MNLTSIAAEARSIARAAGALLRAGFQAPLKIEHKTSEVDWVTQYDMEAEELIVGRLKNTFPDHGIVGEEGSAVDGAGRLTWYVDPLDGTNNFAHHFPLFCVSLGLFEGNTPLVGVVYDVMRDECFHATRDGGAWVDGPDGRQPLTVTPTPRVGEALLATGFPYDRQTNPNNNLRQLEAFLKVATGLRRPGSAALDVVYVGAGRLDGYWEFKVRSWDVAGAWVIAAEAGARITDMSGNPLPMADTMNLVVSNGHIHDEMIDVLKAAA